MRNESILNLELDYELEAKKYYITLAGKRLKTKKANEIFVDSVVLAHSIKEDYSKYKFKSKWINLASSYVDFIENKDDIKAAKEQLISYLKNDLLLYLDQESSEFFKYQEQTYIPLVTKFEKLISLKQKLVPTTGFSKIDISEESLYSVKLYVEELKLKDLFVSLFLTRISTSSILTMLYLSAELSAIDFFELAFNSELIKLEKSHDDEEANRLEIIKQELEIINFFFKEGLKDG